MQNFKQTEINTDRSNTTKPYKVPFITNNIITNNI